MKKILLCVIFASRCFFTSAAEDPKQEINSPIKSVILFLTGAEVTHSAYVNLNPGRNKVVFVGLSPKLNSKSVQVNVPSDITILSVSDRINYLSKNEQSVRIKQLKDSSEMLNDNLRLLRNDKDAFQTEKQMLIANQSIGGQNTGVSIAALKPAADFFRTRVQEINSETYKIEKKEKTIGESLARVQQQLNELNAAFNAPTAEVSILVTVSAKSTVNFELKYVVSNAGWAPIYDLKAEDVDKAIELKYRANVFNNSGFDWNEVKLKLSTADPMQSASQPRMDTWNLDYEQNIYSTSNAAYSQQNEGYLNSIPQSQSQPQYDQNGEFESRAGLTKKATAAVVQYQQIQVSELSAEFDIKNPYSIPSDSKPYLVDITSYTLAATYQHYCVPKIDRDVFLLARITGWEDLDLVEGPANVYYAGAYVGRSYIYTRSTDDTLALSLGRDKKVIVTRVKQKDVTSSKYIGTNKKESYVYEITAKNNRKAPIHIQIEDQVPISKQGDITVDVLDISKAEQDLITGNLKWIFTLAPDENKKINLSFTIKYPKNKAISKKRYKTVSCPSF